METKTKVNMYFSKHKEIDQFNKEIRFDTFENFKQDYMNALSNYPNDVADDRLKEASLQETFEWLVKDKDIKKY